VRVLDFSVSFEGTPYMVMEYVKGETLKSYLKKTGSLSETETIELFLQISDALRHAHDKGVLHRDIKPENILLATSDEGELVAKIVDFGVARISTETLMLSATGDQQLVGTPAYMSPDTVRGLEYDCRSDIYSLGSIMFECVSGRAPFEAESALELLSKKACKEPARLNNIAESPCVTTEFEDVVSKAIARDQLKRYQRMDKLRSDLFDLRTKTPAKSDEFQREIPVSKLDHARSRTRARLYITIGLLFSACLVAALCIWNYLALDKPVPQEIPTKTLTTDWPRQEDTPATLEAEHFLELPFKNSNMYTSVAEGEDPHLEELKPLRTIGGVSVLACPITASGIKVLQNKNIQALHLKRCNLNDDALELIGSLDSLDDLSLEAVNLKGKNTRFLSNLKNLTKLDITHTHIASHDLKNIETLKKLRVLYTSGNQLSDEGLDSVCTLPELEKIFLTSSEITPKGTLALRKLKKLKILHMALCNRIPDSFYPRLKNILPGVEIVWRESNNPDDVPSVRFY
ncbi:MAG: protein kinase, partial [Candidatus Obscuribacterales bacterium]|nr:protein kinase [Candidatus Obscuribacterales bacterium]